MQNFDWTRFTLKIAIDVPVKTLFAAWTQSTEVEKWFLEKCLFSNDGKVLESTENVVSGSDYEWKWFVYPEIEKGKILAADEPDIVSFTFAGDCIVEVKFHREHGQTIVELTQSNIPADDVSKKNIRLGCHDGWSFYLFNLKSVYEGGIDLRNKDERFGLLLNN
ncbi:SRPBCC family protein [Flavobacterium silvaticum]|uniref:SRPBCC domain-containing protein n=1 Tax=Flavobacterium silvaticum TaxID=1852020 RepID=A0A972JHE1_9FLAO|nr:SRPBCC domain-containing protein [Flavobacterium silvaticum]NMH27825.1 SRPBCC domain-containing protein [Flavobacterium silvaticum]